MKTVTARHEKRDENHHLAKQTVTVIVTSLSYHIPMPRGGHAAYAV